MTPQTLARLGAAIVVVSYTVLPWGPGRDGDEYYLTLRGELSELWSDGDTNAQLQAIAVNWGVLIVVVWALVLAIALERMTRRQLGVALVIGLAAFVNHQAIIGTLFGLWITAYFPHVGVAMLSIAIIRQLATASPSAQPQGE